MVKNVRIEKYIASGPWAQIQFWSHMCHTRGNPLQTFSFAFDLSLDYSAVFLCIRHFPSYLLDNFFCAGLNLKERREKKM